MANAKIINYGQPIGAGSTAIPDNTSVALDIESTDAKNYITIDTTDSSEKMVLNSGQMKPVEVGSSNRGPRMTSTTGVAYPSYNFIGDIDTGMTHLGTGNDDQLSLIAGGHEAIRCDATDASEKIIIGDGMPATTAVCIGTDDSLLSTTLQQLTIGHPDGSSKVRVHVQGTSSGCLLTMNAGAAAQNALTEYRDGEGSSRWNVGKVGTDKWFKIYGSTGASGAGTTMTGGYETGFWCICPDGSGGTPAHAWHVQDGDIGIVTNNADDATAKSLIFKRSKSNTDGTPLLVEDEDVLGTIEFQGAEDGDSYATGAKIFAIVDGTPGDGDMPTTLVLAATPNDTETAKEWIRIRGTGTVDKGDIGFAYGCRLAFYDSSEDAKSNARTVILPSASQFQIWGRSSGIDLSLKTGGTEALRVVYEGGIKIGNQTAPSSSATDGCYIWAEDVNQDPGDGADDYSELKVRDEVGNVTTISPHNFSIAERSDPMAWAHHSKNPFVGKEINVDMLAVVREVERLSGKSLVSIRELPEDEKSSWDEAERQKVSDVNEIIDEWEAGGQGGDRPKPYAVKDKPDWMTPND